MSLFGNKVAKKAVAYYRHSAEDKQENSVPLQREQAEKFAAEHGITIIHEEVDEGKSGLTANRHGFQRLFSEWILNDSAQDFDYVLVLDVSRWGRFQDQDEPAHYEFLCKERGIRVVYVSRGFPRGDESPISQLEKPFQRIMAAQYSADLSDKVFKGCVKTSEQGYSNGGTASYGLSRFLLDINKQPVRMLKKGEHKCIANERVIFVPADDATTQTVRDIFKDFTQEGLGINRIVKKLNSLRIPSANGGLWTREKVVRVLSNEVYLGTLTYNKTWNRLKRGHRKNPRSEWVRTEDAIPAIVSRETFGSAQGRLYWLIPSKYRAGILAIQKARRTLRQEMSDYLVGKGHPKIDADYLSQQIPITYSARISGKDHIPRWCFSIKEEVRHFPHVLAVAINQQRSDQVEKIFLLPTDDFAPSGFKILSDLNPDHQSYRVKDDELEKKIEPLVEKVVGDIGR